MFTEVLSPHRPPAPPTEYFQFNVGGYDTANLLRTTTNNLTELQGFIGCVRGLKIGDNLIDLAVIAEENIAHGKENKHTYIAKQTQIAIANTARQTSNNVLSSSCCSTARMYTHIWVVLVVVDGI